MPKQCDRFPNGHYQPEKLNLFSRRIPEINDNSDDKNEEKNYYLEKQIKKMIGILLILLGFYGYTNSLIKIFKLGKNKRISISQVESEPITNSLADKLEINDLDQHGLKNIKTKPLDKDEISNFVYKFHDQSILNELLILSSSLFLISFSFMNISKKK